MRIGLWIFGKTLDGTAIYARLISNARRIFIRHLGIPPGGLNNDAATFAVGVNPGSEAHEVIMCLNEWGKKRISLYTKMATVLQKELEVAHYWSGLAKSNLTSACSGIYTPEHTITLLGSTRGRLIGVRRFSIPRAFTLWCTVSPEHAHLFVRAN